MTQSKPHWTTTTPDVEEGFATVAMLDADGVDDNLRCPCCGCDNVHPSKVEINRGGNLIAVDADGVHRGVGRSLWRGVVIDTTFWCEEGHRFVLRWLFHKGSTSAFIHSVVDVDPDDMTTMWRD